MHKPKKRLNPDTGQLENVEGSSQASCVYFIHYPRSLDAIRFVLQQMQQHVLRNLTCDQNDEGALYYCPPRTVTRKKQVESKLQSGQQSALKEIKRQRAGGRALDAVTIEAAKEIYEEIDDEEFEHRQRKARREGFVEEDAGDHCAT